MTFPYVSSAWADDWLARSTEIVEIYGEGPTKVATGTFHEADTSDYTAEDFRFTTKGDTLYAIELGWPSSGEAVIHSLASNAPGGERVESVELLGSDAKLTARPSTV